MSSSNERAVSGMGRLRSMAPKPSTVPMRVSSPTVGSVTPWRSSSLVWATLGKLSGQVSSGTSSRGVSNCSTRWASQASMAGQRLAVRGDT